MGNTAPTDEFAARLRLHLTPGIGPKRFQQLLEAFGSAQAAVQASRSEWRALGMPDRSLGASHRAEVSQGLEHCLAWLESPHRHILMRGDPEYPALLNEVVDAPPVLYLEGELKLLERPQIALVGSRHASHQGLSNAKAFAKELAAAGFVVTSGLALGIDGAAHQGALDVQGHTLAVLGTGLERLYPQRHQSLARQIVEQGGALLSELPLQTPPQASNFPRRNRLISGLSLGVLVVEASLASGSLITARLAAEQGREVFAIPGSIHHTGAKGCHQLIREGACLVESVADILDALRGWQCTTAPLVESSGPAMAHHPLLSPLLVSPLTAEALTQIVQQPLPQILAALTELELEGRVVCEAGLWTACMPR